MGGVVKERVLHLIGNAHIDPVWLWQWPEGFEEIRATFRAAVDLMDEDPEMTFTADSAAYYAWIEEIDPALFERIRARVADGRWELAGAMWVEPDCNIPSGESFVRHLLVSQSFFQTRFGRRARIGVNVDPFGHTIGLRSSCCGAPASRHTCSCARARMSSHSPRRCSGGAGPTAPSCRRCASRTSTAHRARTSLPPRQGGRPAAARLARVRRVLRRRQPRRRADARHLASIRRLARAGQGPKLAFDTLRAVRGLGGAAGGRLAAGLGRRPPASRGGLLLRALRDQALEPPRGEPAVCG